MDFAGDRDQENVGRDLEEDSPTETAFEGQPKKKTKKKFAETDVVEREDSSSAVPLERKRHWDMTGAQGETVVSKVSVPAPRFARGGSQCQGALAKEGEG